MFREQVAVLLAAAGAEWEADALRVLDTGAPGVRVIKRCVDLPDLLASASTGQAQVALMEAELAGLDADSVAHLRGSGVQPVAVTASEPAADVVARLARQGIDEVVTGPVLPDLRSIVLRVADDSGPAVAPTTVEPLRTAGPARSARTTAVWGPRGAPGRTTLAVGIAAELASRECDVLLVDADAYGGTVAQHLGVLDQVSGLLAAARLANAGRLEPEQLAAVARQVGPRLRVLTGLPRADRWSEVRESAFEHLLELARGATQHLVLDTSSSLEREVDALGGAPRRNAMTVTALEQADEIVVVGAADPVGLTRLARGLVELTETVPGAAVRVVVNRSRPALGWGEQEVRGMVEGLAATAGVHFLPEDRAAADRALVAGRSLVELGDSALRRAVAGLVDEMVGARQPRRRPRRLRPGARR